MRFPDDYPIAEVVRRAAEMRVRVEPLAPCYADPSTAPPGLMLGYANLTESQIMTGVQALAGGDAALALPASAAATSATTAAASTAAETVGLATGNSAGCPRRCRFLAPAGTLGTLGSLVLGYGVETLGVLAPLRIVGRQMHRRGSLRSTGPGALPARLGVHRPLHQRDQRVCQ